MVMSDRTRASRRPSSVRHWGWAFVVLAIFLAPTLVGCGGGVQREFAAKKETNGTGAAREYARSTVRDARRPDLASPVGQPAPLPALPAVPPPAPPQEREHTTEAYDRIVENAFKSPNQDPL